jgi:hypothetical protein
LRSTKIITCSIRTQLRTVSLALGGIIGGEI